jgi:hypothetical protein
MVALALLDARCRHIVLASLLGVMVTLPGCARSERSSAAAVADSSVRLIAVAPDVRLEVLDWGGTGPAMVFLAGMGGEPDSYRAFASRFRDGYHLYGINRRGEGGSDTPMSGVRRRHPGARHHRRARLAARQPGDFRGPFLCRR